MDPSRFERNPVGLLRAGARCAVVGGAPETWWQAGRLPQFQRRKLLEVKDLWRLGQPANPPSKLAGWQADRLCLPVPETDSWPLSHGRQGR